MAALGDERLFELLERHGEAIARGDAAAVERGDVAELVERCAWAKVEVVVADERERGPRGGRITLNLGHSLGHAVEAAAGYARPAPRRGRRLRASRRVPDRRGGRGHAAGAGGADHGPAGRAGPRPRAPPLLRSTTVLEHLATDKKHSGGRLRWVLPTADGVEVRAGHPRRGRRRGRRVACWPPGARR